MSITNSAGERVFLAPEPYASRPVRSKKIQRRNREWLALKRTMDLTVREIAPMVRSTPSTVARGILWAEEEEQRDEERLVESMQSPEVCPISGLTLTDVCYLLDTYPPSTELGDHPMFWQILGPLWAKVVAMYPGLADLSPAEAA